MTRKLSTSSVIVNWCKIWTVRLNDIGVAFKRATGRFSNRATFGNFTKEERNLYDLNYRRSKLNSSIFICQKPEDYYLYYWQKIRTSWSFFPICKGCLIITLLVTWQHLMEIFISNIHDGVNIISLMRSVRFLASWKQW